MFANRSPIFKTKSLLFASTSASVRLWQVKVDWPCSSTLKLAVLRFNNDCVRTNELDTRRFATRECDRAMRFSIKTNVSVGKFCPQNKQTLEQRRRRCLIVIYLLYISQRRSCAFRDETAIERSRNANRALPADRCFNNTTGFPLRKLVRFCKTTRGRVRIRDVNNESNQEVRKQNDKSRHPTIRPKIAP